MHDAHDRAELWAWWGQQLSQETVLMDPCRAQKFAPREPTLTCSAKFCRLSPPKFQALESLKNSCGGGARSRSSRCFNRRNHQASIHCSPCRRHAGGALGFLPSLRRNQLRVHIGSTLWFNPFANRRDRRLRYRERSPRPKWRKRQRRVWRWSSGNWTLRWGWVRWCETICSRPLSLTPV